MLVLRVSTEHEEPGDRTRGAAELAAQSEKKVAVVYDHPPRLREESAEHIAAPNMGAGGSHLQAEMMQLSPSANLFHPTGQILLAPWALWRRARSAARVVDAKARVDEVVDLYVKATGKDGVRMRERLVNMRPDELWRSQEQWRGRAEETQRSRVMKEEAWECFRRHGGLRRRTTRSSSRSSSGRL